MNVTLKDLLDAGVHFGHQTRRYNPKSKKFVYDHRHGISIIDLEKTYDRLEKACAFVEDLVASGKDILFVGHENAKRRTSFAKPPRPRICLTPPVAGWGGRADQFCHRATLHLQV